MKDMKLHQHQLQPAGVAVTGVMWLYLVSSLLAVVHGQDECRVNAPHGLRSVLPPSWGRTVSTVTLNSADNYQEILLIREKTDLWKLTVLCFMLVLWHIQILQRVAFLPSMVPFSFNFVLQLLGSRTCTGSTWPLTWGPTLCWLNLVNVKCYIIKTYSSIILSNCSLEIKSNYTHTSGESRKKLGEDLFKTWTCWKHF